jgi:hypothetical protein
MRLEIPHTLGRDEVRRRIAARMDTAEDKASALAGGAVDLSLDWTGDYTLAVEASAMGFTVPSTLDITDTALMFDVTIPPGMGFARGMIERTIHEKGEKLLA